jgi:hypothetical protein
MRFKVLLLFAACFLGSLASVASASILGGVLTTGLNTFNDKNREILIKDAANNDPLKAETLEVNDILLAVLFFDNFTNANGPSNVNDIPGLAGLTAFSQIKVTSVTPVSGAIYNFTFDGAFSNGDAVQVFESSTLNDVNDFSSGGVLGNIADATNGTPLFTLALSDSDDFWTANGPADLSFVANGDAEVTFKFGLSVNLNPALVPVLPDAVFSLAEGSFHDVTGSGTVYNIDGPTNGWAAASDTTIRFRANPIPEPLSAIAWTVLAGVALLPTGRFRR